MSASRFMLAIDGVTVNDYIRFAAGLAMLFASYFNLSIMYSINAVATLEFIERNVA